MFKSKLWTGLRSKSLRDSIRDVYANIKDFFRFYFYREIRKVEQEKTSTETFNKDAKAAALHTRPPEDSTETTNKLLKAIKRIEKIWKRNKVTKQKSPKK